MRFRTPILAMAVGVGLLLAWQGSALADQGPHNQFDEEGNTASGVGCQRCHAPHRGQAANLIRQSTTYALCTTCHSSAERTDVVAGSFLSGAGNYNTPNSYGADDPAAGTPTYTKQLNGGRFGNGAQSWHKVKDTEETSTRTIYGSGSTDATDSTMTTFKCTSCHDPHGKKLSSVASTVTSQPNGSSDQYRLLNSIPVYSWEDTTTTGNSASGATKSYTKQAHKWESSEPNQGISAFCATCHTDYLSLSSAATNTPNAPGGSRWVHRMNVAISSTYATNLDASNYPLPVAQASAFRGFWQTSASTPKASGAAEYAKWSGGSKVSASYDGTNDRLVCTSCHAAHGTVATAADTSTTYNRAGTHSLLLFDERAVCQSCHKKNPSY